MSRAISFDPEQAKKVRGGAHVHQQHPATPGERMAHDFYQQVMLKHPYLSDFCSRAAYLHAGLLEGDPSVDSFTPRPYRLRIGNKIHVPTCYVISTARRRRVVEITSDGTLADELRIPLEHYFALQKIDLEVISNAAVYAHQTEAENWLTIVGILYRARDIDVGDAEYQVITHLTAHGPCSLQTLIDPGDRTRTYNQEIALLRLLHRGLIAADLSTQALDFDTELSLCA